MAFNCRYAGLFHSKAGETMIDVFLSKFGIKKFDYLTVDNRFYLVSEELQKLAKEIKRQPDLIGLYLGEVKDGKFSPSLGLLSLMAKNCTEKIWIKDIGENDFLYGKNLRPRHIIKIEGTMKEGFLKIAVNEKNECLGLAKIKKITGNEVSLRNVLDLGDYLRRERK